MAVDVVTTDITKVSQSFSVLGFFIIVYGLISYVAKEKLYLSEPLIATVVGIVCGPYVLGWVDPLSWGDIETTNYITYQFTRLVIGVQVLFTGISLPKAYLRKEALSITVLLGLIMTTAWFAVALLVWGLIPGLTFLESLAMAAAVTPTDPVLANSITKGRYAEKHVPVNLRNLLNAEAGANDGLGFPFLYLAIYLLGRTGVDQGTSVGTEIGRWIYGALLYQIGVSIAYGALVGYIFRKSLKWSEERQYIDKDNFFAYGLGLALFVLGTTGLFGSDDILACFVAGNSYTWDDWYRVRTEDNDVQDILDMLLNAAVFIYIGAIIPWSDYSNAEIGLAPWRVVVLAILVLLLRRPPWVIACYKIIPALSSVKEAAFSGWFGPIGVGAVFYIQVAMEHIPDDGTRDHLREVYNPVVLFVAFASILTHGVTIPVSKLGPTVVRRTATLTKTRSITFSRPNSRPTSIKEEPVRHPWNPLISLRDGILSVALFWRKDSFWRRPPTNREGGWIRPQDISSPTDAVKQIEMDQVPGEKVESDESPVNEHSGDSSSDDGGGARRSRVPPPAMDLPTTNPSSRPSSVKMPRASTMPVKPAAALDPTQDQVIRNGGNAPPPSTPPRQHHHEGMFGGIRDAWEKEMAAERAEAKEEADSGWPASIRALLAEQQAEGNATGSSTPGTPGGSRIRFDLANNSDSSQQQDATPNRTGTPKQRED